MIGWWGCDFVLWTAFGVFCKLGKRSGYLFGLVSYLLMGYVAFRNHLYGTGSFYLFACAPLQIHGFINWRKNLEDANVKLRKSLWNNFDESALHGGMVAVVGK